MHKIAPVNDFGKIQHVHRNMLKARLQPEPQDIPPDRPSVTVMPTQEEASDDLWHLVSISSNGSCTSSAPTICPSSNVSASAEVPVLASVTPDVQETRPRTPPTLQL